MSKILVAIDGTERSQRTLKSAAELAKKEQSELVILYACDDAVPSDRQLEFAEREFGRKFRNLVTGKELPSFSVNDTDGARSISEYMKARKQLCCKFGTSVLDHAKNTLKAAGLNNITTRIERGDITKTILDVARAETADKIVVGNCKKTNWLQFFNGCTAKEVLKKAPCEAVIVD